MTQAGRLPVVLQFLDNLRQPDGADWTFDLPRGGKVGTGHLIGWFARFGRKCLSIRPFPGSSGCFRAGHLISASHADV